MGSLPDGPPAVKLLWCARSVTPEFPRAVWGTGSSEVRLGDVKTPQLSGELADRLHICRDGVFFTRGDLDAARASKPNLLRDRLWPPRLSARNQMRCTSRAVELSMNASLLQGADGSRASRHSPSILLRPPWRVLLNARNDAKGKVDEGQSCQRAWQVAVTLHGAGGWFWPSASSGVRQDRRAPGSIVRRLIFLT